MSTAADVAELRALLRATAEHARNQLRVLVNSDDVLDRLKFERLGCDPLDLKDSQNLAEQIDQQATYEAAVDALEYAMGRHPGKSWRFAPGAHGSGHDIASTDGLVIGEVFAAVSPSNNRKLAKDILKVSATVAPHRYVFYRSPGFGPSEEDRGSFKLIALAPRKR